MFTSQGRLLLYTLTKTGKATEQLAEQLVQGRVTHCSPTGNSLVVAIEPEKQASTENMFFIELRNEFKVQPFDPSKEAARN